MKRIIFFVVCFILCLYIAYAEETIACYNDRECPDTFEKYCGYNRNAACQKAVEYTCVNPGSPGSYCQATGEAEYCIHCEHYYHRKCYENECHNTKPTDCIDSDGGRNKEIKGTVQRYKSTTYTDKCVNETVLKEYYCHNYGHKIGEMDSKIYTCPNTCSDGMCVNEENKGFKIVEFEDTPIQPADTTATYRLRIEKPDGTLAKARDGLHLNWRIETINTEPNRRYYIKNSVRNIFSTDNKYGSGTYDRDGYYIININAPILQGNYNLKFDISCDNSACRDKYGSSNLHQEWRLIKVTGLGKEKGCTLVNEEPTNSYTYVGLDTAVSTYSDITRYSDLKKYRIKWEDGSWSRWYYKGENDINHDNPNSRMWWYFRTHEHEYLVCGGNFSYNCTDTDNGLDYFTKGTVIDDGLEYVDECQGNFVIEYYCKNKMVKEKKYVCKTSCNNGACNTIEDPELEKQEKEQINLSENEQRTESILISRDKARATAMSKGMVRIKSIELKEADGWQYYEIKGTKKFWFIPYPATLKVDVEMNEIIK